MAFILIPTRGNQPGDLARNVIDDQVVRCSSTCPPPLPIQFTADATFGDISRNYQVGLMKDSGPSSSRARTQQQRGRACQRRWCRRPVTWRAREWERLTARYATRVAPPRRQAPRQGEEISWAYLGGSTQHRGRQQMDDLGSSPRAQGLKGGPLLACQERLSAVSCRAPCEKRLGDA